MESYKERKANYSQTLTGLGKWWGRKPLVLVRATLLGLLMPASKDPVKDREIFLKLMTMDPDGLRMRKTKSIPGKRLVEELRLMPPSIRNRFLDETGTGLNRFSRDERTELQLSVFDRMSYSEKLEYCDRPEQMDGPSPDAWVEINAHLQTHANSLPELVEQLGKRHFGHRPRVGDAFCGGGSVPFEAARLGYNAYGSDLNPVAALLTWAAINVIGGGQNVVENVREAQHNLFELVDRQVTEWGIEHNSFGWRADAYLYCVEVIDPETGWRVPLAPSWIIGEKTNTIAKLIRDEQNRRYDIEILESVSPEEMKTARESGTVENFRLVPPNGAPSTPLEAIRRNQRMWGNDDIAPRYDDVFQERLYCIRWVETYVDENGRVQTRRHYRSPTSADMERETKVLELLRERFSEWQARSYIPSRRIEPGQDINRPTNARGWTHWHHLFNPRQLLISGLFAQFYEANHLNLAAGVGVLLGIGRVVDWNSRLSRWHPNAANEKGEQTFYKPSLSTPLVSYACRSTISLQTAFLLDLVGTPIYGSHMVSLRDARSVSWEADMWITDPPYADAVNYHELSEFFLAWYERLLCGLVPNWYTDSRRALAIKGTDSNFRIDLMQCYQRLAHLMPDNGLQIVMFTHNDTSVWADLAMILWAANLRVSAAWTIATETDSTLKQGNYVQGTVLLVLRKRTETEPVFLDEIYQEIEMEVRRQLDFMLVLEDDSDPNFGDADYQLAAYAAALRVLTARPIYEIDPAKEIVRERVKGEVGPVEQLIRNAVKIACDHLVPKGFDGDLWKTLSPTERFYLKGVEVESHAEYRSGVYQELARGFGAADYADLLANTRANETRLKSANEFGRRMLSGGSFGATLVRQILFAVHLAVKSEETRDGLNYLKTELPDYWSQRAKTVHILGYLARLQHVAGMEHWRKDAEAAALLAGAVQNDHV
jgi:adenine-specific DNA methylase